jgi:hypothetical protein
MERRNFLVAWTTAGELPRLTLADSLELLLLARATQYCRVFVRYSAFVEA